MCVCVCKHFLFLTVNRISLTRNYFYYFFFFNVKKTSFLIEISKRAHRCCGILAAKKRRRVIITLPLYEVLRTTRLENVYRNEQQQ